MNIYLNMLVLRITEENTNKIIKSLNMDIIQDSIKLTVPLMEVETYDIR